MTRHPLFIKLAAWFGWVQRCNLDGGEPCHKVCLLYNFGCIKWKFAPEVTE